MHPAITTNGDADIIPFNPSHPSTPAFAGRLVKTPQAGPFARIPDTAKIWGSVILSAVITALVIYAVRLFMMDLGFRAPIVTKTWIYSIFSGVFYVYAIGVLMPFCLFLLWRGIASKQPDNTHSLSMPFVSIVIPAFNEGSSVARAIDCALSQDYPAFEVIIVDDGSKDLTKYIVNRYRARLISLRRNGGKAAALNVGLQHAKGDIVVFSDSDSFLDRKALRRLVGNFDNPHMGAVAGRVQIRQCSSLVRKLQELEYVFGQDIIKTAQMGSGASVSVCPGPICAFRRSILVEHGGISGRTLAEDFDLTLHLIDLGWGVKYDSMAIAYTDAPGTWRDLIHQRIRWCRGALQVFSNHKKLFFSRRSSSLGLFWLPYFLLIGFGGALFEALAIIVIPVLIFLSGAPLALFKSGLVFMGLIETICILQYVAAVFLSNNAPNKLALWALLIKPFNLVLTGVRLIAMWRELTGARRCW